VSLAVKKVQHDEDIVFFEQLSVNIVATDFRIHDYATALHVVDTHFYVCNQNRV
jgi:hypothetical protein